MALTMVTLSGIVSSFFFIQACHVGHCATYKMPKENMNMIMIFFFNAI